MYTLFYECNSPTIIFSLSLSLSAPLSPHRHTPTHALFPSLSHPYSHPLSLFPLACLVAAPIQQATTLSPLCALTYETFTYDRPRQFRRTVMN